MIKIEVDPRPFLQRLTDAQEKQIPFAVAKALNQTANQAQKAEREHIKKVFKLRASSFVLAGVKIEKADRATKQTWAVVIQLKYPQDRKFLNLHEPGGERTAYRGGRLWQPNKDVFKNKIIGTGNPLHPKNLKLKRNSSGRIQGEERAFLIRTKGGKVLVLQRVDRDLTKGSKRKLGKLSLDNLAGGQGPNTKAQKLSISRTGGTRLLYRLVSKVKLPARLEFVSTVRKTVELNWRTNMHEALAYALKTAR